MCGKPFDSYACECPFCDACGEKTDHETRDHKFDEGELWCWEKFGCLETDEHDHRDEIDAIKHEYAKQAIMNDFMQAYEKANEE